MQGWFSILIMIALGAGFALISDPPVQRPRAVANRRREKSAPYRMRHAGGRGRRAERQSVKFYLVAMIFLLFDIEVAFLYPWAMALRDLGWGGFVQVLLFMALLLFDRLRLRLAQGRARLGAIATRFENAWPPWRARYPEWDSNSSLTFPC